jgi:hypothetical protein
MLKCPPRKAEPCALVAARVFLMAMTDVNDSGPQAALASTWLSGAPTNRSRSLLAL